MHYILYGVILLLKTRALIEYFVRMHGTDCWSNSYNAFGTERDRTSGQYHSIGCGHIQ